MPSRRLPRTCDGPSNTCAPFDLVSQGKNSVVFFYGADSAPSCSKQIEAFDSSLSEFQSAGATVVGVRNEKGATLEGKNVKLVVDEGDELRKELGIKEDLFGLLGGRET